ncbi:MAG TPA: hypothetical protein VGE59_04175 [Patescibacteria group bacterium]
MINLIKKLKKSFQLLPRTRSALLSLSIILAAFLVSGGLLMYDYTASHGKAAEPQPTATATPEPWKTYTNEAFHFSIQYPADWKIGFRDSTQIHFFPPEAPDFNPDSDGQGPIVVFIYPKNSTGLAPKEYKQRLFLRVDGLEAVTYSDIPAGYENVQTHLITDTYINHPEAILGVTFFNEVSTPADDDLLIVYQAMLNTLKQAQ